MDAGAKGRGGESGGAGSSTSAGAGSDVEPTPVEGLQSASITVGPEVDPEMEAEASATTEDAKDSD